MTSPTSTIKKSLSIRHDIQRAQTIPSKLEKNYITPLKVIKFVWLSAALILSSKIEPAHAKHTCLTDGETRTYNFDGLLAQITFHAATYEKLSPFMQKSSGHLVKEGRCGSFTGTFLVNGIEFMNKNTIRCQKGDIEFENYPTKFAIDIIPTEDKKPCAEIHIELKPSSNLYNYRP